MSKYKIQTTNKFKKAYKKLISNPRYNENDFKEMVNMLINDETLPQKYHNHLLEPKSKRIMGMPYKSRLAINIY